jgi:CheY-like chemotaxis protein
MTDAFAACNERKFDCAILDYRLPGCDGLEGISSLHDKEPYMPIVMLTGKGDEHIATEAMKRGASDYLPKARVDPVLIKRVIESAVEKSALRRKVDQQRRELEKFASGLVYDLKSPIAAMQTFARFIEEDVRAPTTDKNRIAMHCQAVALAGRRINTLIDALYAYTKADAHSTFEPVDVTAALEDAVAALRVLIKERGAKVPKSSDSMCLSHSAGCLTRAAMMAPALALRPAEKSSSATKAGSGANPRTAKARRSFSRCRPASSRRCPGSIGHAVAGLENKAWMAGSSPAGTGEMAERLN